MAEFNLCCFFQEEFYCGRSKPLLSTEINILLLVEHLQFSNCSALVAQLDAPTSLQLFSAITKAGMALIYR